MVGFGPLESINWSKFLDFTACVFGLWGIAKKRQGGWYSAGVLSCFSCVRLFATLWIAASQALCPWNSPGKNTGVDSHSLLQGIFSTQGSNMGLLHCRCIIYYLTHQRSRHKADIILHNSLLRKLRLELLQNLPNLSLFLDSGDLEFVTLSDSKAYIFPILFKKQKQKQKNQKNTFTLPELYFSISR